MGLPMPRAVAVLASCAILVAGCGKSANGSIDSDNSKVKTGPGVTSDSITVGALTDLSGVFAAQGKVVTVGNELYFDKVNESGGVCGRKIKLLTKDHENKGDKAASLYSEMQPQVLGIVQVLASYATAAVDGKLAADDMLAVGSGWAEGLLKNPNWVLVGTTYDIEIINGIKYLADSKALKSGDLIGHIYYKSEYGETAIKGSRFAAEKLGLKLEAYPIEPTAVDLAAQVTALRDHGAKAIVLSNGPRQTAAVASVARSIGLNVPILANTPAFDPMLLDTPAKETLQANLLVESPTAPYAADVRGAKDIATTLPKKYPDVKPNGQVELGYVSALILTEVLRKACSNKDLTRQGVLKAYRQVDSVDTLGLTAALDYTTRGKAPTRETYLQKVDAAAAGGLTILQPLTVSDLAKAYAPAS